MTADAWKRASRPIGRRLFELEEKAADAGWTPEERAEHDRLQGEWTRLLGEFAAAASGRKTEGGRDE